MNNGEFNSQNGSTSKPFSLEVVGERSSEIQFQPILLGAFFFCDGDNGLDHPAFKLIP